MNMRFDALQEGEHGPALAFFGGDAVDARVAPIGAAASLIGSFDVHEPTPHSSLFYLARFLQRCEAWIAREDTGTGSRQEEKSSRLPPQGSELLAEGYQIAMSLSGVPLLLEFVARVLIRRNEDSKQMIVASPIYVAFAQ